MLIKNARIVTRDEVMTGVVMIRDGVFEEVQRGTTAVAEAVDWHGDYLVPGLVELHTDNLEKHAAPGEGAAWQAEAAVVAHDAQMAAAGITTVLNGIAIGSQPTVAARSRELPLNCAEALRRLGQHKLLRVEHLLHLRCELAASDVVEMFDMLSTHPLLRLCSVMDHTPGQRQWHDLGRWRRVGEHGARLSDSNFESMVVELSTLQERYAERNRREIVSRCRDRALPLASHDDSSAEQIAQAKSEGIALAEFPVTREAAVAARASGMAIVMGAPNLVRGLSHAGNVSALDLSRDGLVDVFSSDYVPSSLLTAAFELSRRAMWTLPKAITAMSEMPARQVGLDDRGAIAARLRADFCRVMTVDHLPVVRQTFVKGMRVA
ncbi:Metal-dependent hydrolase involved in phosphonate metabolism [Paraburkholderia unamae]|uniref:alpha-D-ribose 1-methylphosphonate 5-triphosphate diphosphatase n=1 Tax=Paraburkholderia unamae TaxID=219649 RepID=UPI001CAEF95B|nr:alpha-D-ribose 1-methylphosphonate 5-triphosphate diphosphatase [Paraburkholderia unamae]CAG9271505.1 Metal-dependent hydrolase involved in phosphonate metabolism [Paraburkholderia unamae]